MLVVQDLRKSFREPDGSPLPILDIKHFQLAAGEQAVLMGKSGCGKTTLLHVIAGIARPDSGSVRVDGTEITRLSEAGRDRFRADKIGYVFQTFNLLPGFSALENVLLGMSFTGRSADAGRARELLKRVGMSHRLSHRPAMLSVGEQQRVAVARALANRPKLLLADEPTANVDAAHQQQIVELLRSTCQEENVALLIVTHTGEVAEQFARVDRLEHFNQAVAAV
jgi:putative ABC transport system ATP-binding protein